MNTYLNRFFHVFALCLLFLSCVGKNSLEYQMNNFLGQEIILPAELMRSFEDDSLDYNSYKAKLVIWFDSTECSSCRMNRLYEFGESPTVQYAKFIKQFSVLFIFSPKESEAHLLKRTLNTHDLPFHVWVDENSAFVKQNQCLPKDRRLHSFLLSQDNEVVFTGNPINHEKLWELYKKQIIELTQN